MFLLLGATGKRCATVVKHVGSHENPQPSSFSPLGLSLPSIGIRRKQNPSEFKFVFRLLHANKHKDSFGLNLVPKREKQYIFLRKILIDFN